MQSREYPRYFLLIFPAAIIFISFFAVPMARLAVVGTTGEEGFAAYLAKQVSLPVSFEKQMHRLSCSKNGFDSRISNVCVDWLI